MGIALTDDHRELSGVARAFLTSQKVRWAARASLDAAGTPARRSGRTSPSWAGSACISTSDTVALAMACRACGGDRRARSCGGTGAVCADRDRLSGGRQRRY